MEQYQISGMSCAACQARIEKAVSKVPGVTSAAVSLLTNQMGVEGTAQPEAVIAAVKAAGYGAEQMRKSGTAAAAAGQMKKPGAYESASLSAQEEALKDHETPVLKRRLMLSLTFLIVLMYFSMGHHMLGLPVPGLFEGNMTANAILQMLLAIAVMIINGRFFVSGLQSLRHGAPNMDTLVALGSGAAFVFSTAVLFLLTDAVARGDAGMIKYYSGQFYFESAAMIPALITVGKLLEAVSKGRTTDALKSLIRMAPKTAVILENGEEKTIPAEQLAVGDIFIVRPGESIPVDGIVEEGMSAVNEAALTGESIPVDKQAGDSVSAASINQSGFLKCRASRVGEDTTLSQIIKMVSDAAATKAPIAKTADKAAAVFVPAVMSIAAVTFAVWMLLGADTGFALARAISVLVISCPCALGLATPVAIMVGNGIGAKNGIMFKTAVSLEETGRAGIVVMDKTGTVTEGSPSVTDVLTADGVTGDELLRTAFALESKSEHPLAGAVVRYCSESFNMKPDISAASDFMAFPGNGLSAVIDGRRCTGGNAAFISKEAGISIPERLAAEGERLSGEGKTPLYFAAGGRLLGIISAADTIKPESTQAVSELKGMGIRVVMLTGDNEKTASAIGKQAGISEVIAGVLPDGKEAVIRQLKEQGRVIMVGDGINDSPALTRADIGMAIGAGTDIAIDAADVVLMKSRLNDVPAAIRLSRAVLKNIKQNLFWAFFYNALCIPLAAGCYTKLFGWALSPMIGAAAMSLSSFFVVSNALRLNLMDIYDASHDRRAADNGYKDAEGIETIYLYKENKEMSVKTMKIEGMMCMHCEAAVKKALEALENVEAAAVSHEKGTAEVTLKGDVEDEVLRKAVEDKDYKVISIG